MSSLDQNATVLFYPGADASEMLDRMWNDPKFKALNVHAITKIFLLTGSNNIDDIYSGKTQLQNGLHDISRLINSLRSHFGSAKINSINILPRFTKGKNDIVTELNRGISNICIKYGLNFIDTGNLFTDSYGKRRSQFFSKNGRDNVHLSVTGMSRFAKHLKFMAHTN